eukprot:3771969-Rhodomonas_salina.1
MRRRESGSKQPSTCVLRCSAMAWTEGLKMCDSICVDPKKSRMNPCSDAAVETRSANAPLNDTSSRRFWSAVDCISTVPPSSDSSLMREPRMKTASLGFSPPTPVGVPACAGLPTMPPIADIMPPTESDGELQRLEKEEDCALCPTSSACTMVSEADMTSACERAMCRTCARKCVR